MRTIYSSDTVTVERDPRGMPGDNYLIDGDVTADDNAMCAILLDRAEIADSRKLTQCAATRHRVTAIKEVMDGDQERGRGAPKKRGPYKKKDK